MSANLKKRLQNGERLIGTMINRIDTLDIIPMLKACGMDYVIVDNEHGTWNPEKIADMALLCNSTGLGALIRIPVLHRPYVQQYLDCGFDGIMLPNCHNAEIERELVGLCKYEPDGNRGISIMRGHCGYNAVDDPEEFMRRKNEETIVIVQIESRDGLKNVGEIAAVPGVDIALIGPNDLSHSLGIMGQYHNPEFIRATEDVAAACKKAGKWAAIQATNPAAMREYMERGFDFILYGNEVSLLMSAARQCVGEFKKICSDG